MTATGRTPVLRQHTRRRQHRAASGHSRDHDRRRLRKASGLTPQGQMMPITMALQPRVSAYIVSCFCDIEDAAMRAIIAALCIFLVCGGSVQAEQPAAKVTPISSVRGSVRLAQANCTRLMDGDRCQLARPSDCCSLHCTPIATSPPGQGVCYCLQATDTCHDSNECCSSSCTSNQCDP
jgi:hypothetical protein